MKFSFNYQANLNDTASKGRDVEQYHLCGAVFTTSSDIPGSSLIKVYRPVAGSSEVPRNPLTRWDVSSIPANGIFLT